MCLSWLLSIFLCYCLAPSPCRFEGCSFSLPLWLVFSPAVCGSTLSTSGFLGKALWWRDMVLSFLSCSDLASQEESIAEKVMTGNKRSEAEVDQRDWYTGDVYSVEFVRSQLKWTLNRVDNTDLHFNFP